MSVVLRTIEAFPRGRTTDELFALLEIDFKAVRREEVRAELLTLQKEGRLILGSDRKWRAASRVGGVRPATTTTSFPGLMHGNGDVLTAAPARFMKEDVLHQPKDSDSEGEKSIGAIALLRYYRAALQSDPRGALTQSDDRHGTAYQLISGEGDPMPGGEQIGVIRVELANLPGSFREALFKREANERTLAVGWPISVDRKSGAPAIRPVGLIAATWERGGDSVDIRIETDDVMVNPDWVRAAARRSGWSADRYSSAFAGQGGTGLHRDEFLSRLREAAATAIQGRLTGQRFAATLDPVTEGISDSMGLFLPTETSFTAGAVRDLDAIGGWERERISRTALGPLLGLPFSGDIGAAAPVNLGPLNHEQIRAVANAMGHPLSVVTGPPGTGKSQAIVAMTATAMLGGKSVVVASKNHQALDAVQQRLTDIAPDVPFLVRTLDPANEIDVGIIDVVSMLVKEPSSAVLTADAGLLAQLDQLCNQRVTALDRIEECQKLNTTLADLIETIEHRQFTGATMPMESPPGIWQRLIGWLYGRKKSLGVPAVGAPMHELESAVKLHRARLAEIGKPDDPVKLTDEIQSIAKIVLRQVLSKAAALTEDDRISLSNEHDDLNLHGGKAMSRGVTETILAHRPLWLASVLGTPRRIPLYEGIFDLVIFDEASQCDIASALPLLARARQAVIVGDDRQLAFISQIGLKQDRNLMAANALPDRGTGRFSQGQKSLFDLARSTRNVPAVMLRNQYRSAEAIVEYINKEFYGGKLRVSANLGSLKLPKSCKAGLAWTHVPGPVTSSHYSQNVNLPEVKAILKEVKALILEQGYEGTIGVISPFRPQVHKLEQALRDAIPGTNWKSAELRVGTIDGFQGQERDLILFSPTVHARIKASAVTFVQRDWRRLNVAISRARSVAHVFGDLTYARSGAINHLRSLAARATEPRRKSGSDAFDSEWERIVFDRLEKRGLDPQPQYEIAGRRLDFALFGTGNVKLDLEVDGRRWHQDTDGNRKLDDHWRDYQMRSLGWKVRRFWVDELKQDMEACLDLVEQDLE